MELKTGVIAFLLVVVLVLALLFWPAKPQPGRPGIEPPPNRPFQLDLHDLVEPPGDADFPKTDGSASTQALGQLVGYELLDVAYEWSRQPDGSRWLGVKDYSALQPLFKRGLYLRHAGTHEAYVRLADGGVGLIYVTRKPSAEEVALAAGKGVRFETTPIALDAYVFAVNKHNPVSNVTVGQLRDVYAGKTTNWSQLGGAKLPIDVETSRWEFARSFVRKDVLAGSGSALEATAPKAEEQALPNPVTQKPGAIQCLPWHVARFMARHGTLRLLSVGGVAPTSETIEARTYPFVYEIYAVIRADEKQHSPARRLRDWLLGLEGRALSRKCGCVTKRPEE